MTLPTATTPGYGTFRGRVACVCLIEWLPAYESELQRRGIIGGALPIAQLVGDAPASDGTHFGGAFDLWMTVRDAVWIAREMGADATWIRDWTGNKHTHGVLRGCPHNGNARYQIAAVDAGFNGLGTNGRAGPDDGPRPLSGRTWREGITWMEEHMPLTDEDLDRIANRVVNLLLATELGNEETVRVNIRRAGDTKALATEVVDRLDERWGDSHG